MRQPPSLLPALLFLLGLCACSEEPCVPNDSTGRPPFGLLVTGERVDISLYPFDNGGCVPEGVVPTRFTAEVSGPDGQPVPNEALLGSSSGVPATLRLTPETPGRHHMLVAFEPVGGLQQFDLQVAKDRTRESTLERVPDACRTLERTARGAWLCDTRVFREGITKQTLPDGRQAVSGDVVWVVNEQETRRYVDRGDQLELTAVQPHFEGPPKALLATDEELVVLHNQRLQRLRFDGTTLVLTASTDWGGADPSSGATASLGLLLRTGDRLAVIGYRPALGNRLSLCAYQLEADRIALTQEPCQILSGSLMGFEGSVLWMGEPSPTTSLLLSLHRLEWTGSQLEPRGSLFLDETLPLIVQRMDRTSTVPVLGMGFPLRGIPARTGVPVYSPERGEVYLEHLDAESIEPQASTNLFWSSAPNGSTEPGTRIRLRPSTP
ncbi:hypothetical protein [Hyalangium rubrum]|uniref:Lipoprotein n=1 Tax=Hyalangium rubrum TaxID=3103134 RepID=A0ABU5H3X0_9BACT|nr:hypothetical protein [Hyalangium sp. s54d21]MDY7227799.1 hypothetical protein [Hyalangium sp. s54d21]